MIVLCSKGPGRVGVPRYPADQIKVLLTRPDCKDQPRRFLTVGAMRQWLESVNDTLKGHLDWNARAGAPSLTSTPRIAQRLLAWPRTSGTTGPSARPAYGP